ncbi:MAG TPA: FmdB family zinc ribbon protein [Acidimicrobiales bacterium]
MPTYEYRCKTCGEHLEVVQSFTDDPLTECPNCAGELRKVFSPIGITFKGSGFYKTDSRAGSATSSRSSSGASSSDNGSSGSSGSSDSKSSSDSKTSSDSKGSSSSSSGTEAKSA